MIEVSTLPTIADVTQIVRGYSSRVRIGIVLLTAKQVGMELKLATQHQLGFVDYQKYKVEQLDAEQRFLSLSARSLLEDIDAILAQDHTHNAILLANTDLALACLSHSERKLVWQFLLDSLAKRPTGLLVAMPHSAQQLMPVLEDFERWTKENRVGAG